MTLDPATLRQIKAEWAGAPRGSKSAVVQKWAEFCGVNPATVYRQLNANGSKKRVKRARKIEDVEAQAALVASIKKRPPEHRGEICTADAVEIAKAAGYDITASASHIDRVIRECGLKRQPRRVIRFQADYPNQLHHVDASTSNCFYVARRLENGDAVLKLYKGYQGYKNKPIPVGLRPWIYGCVDDHSGLSCARYIAAEGESMADCLDFLCWAWSGAEGKDLRGLPEFLKADHGPLMKSKDATEFLDRLGIAIDPSIPGQKDAHGKVERPWRTMWQRFELPFWSEDPKTFEIPLSELNQRLANYLLAYNGKPHRWERKHSRRDVWSRINQRGGAVILAEDAIRRMVRRYERTVAQDGTIQLDGKVYEVKGLHSAKVRLWEGLRDGRMVAEDLKTGERFEVVEFCPQGFCDYKGVPDTGDQRARETAAEMAGTENPLYREAPESPGVVRFPVRTAEVIEPEDKIAADAYPTAAEAIRDFVALTGIAPDAQDRADLEALIEENGRSRQFIRDLAAEAVRSNAM